MTDDAGFELHTLRALPPDAVAALAAAYRRDGIVKVTHLLPADVRRRAYDEASRLLESFAERRDLRLATTGNTPRKMSVVRSEVIKANSAFVRSLYDCAELKDV